MKVELSKRAQRAVTRIDARWRKRADHPELFFEEMLEVVEHLDELFVKLTRGDSDESLTLERGCATALFAAECDQSRN